MDNMVLNYQGIKDAIKTELNRVAESFVEIGYRLKQVRDGELYKIDGYKNINEFAKAEYNLSQSTTSRFIKINDYFSVNGSSTKLLEQYEGYGYSKLSEMLTLSEEEMKLISLRTTVAEIREIKQVKKEAEIEIYATSHNAESLENTQSESDSKGSENYIIPEANKIIIEFFRDKSRRSILKELAAVLSDDINNDIITKAIEIINPSGHLMFKKGLIIMMFEEDHIKYSKFGGLNTQFTYSDLFHDIYLVFDMSAPDPAIAFYGEPEPEAETVKKEVQVEVKDKPAWKEENKKPEKPTSTQAIKVSEQAKNEDDVNIPGQKSIDVYPECVPDISENEEKSVEVVEADIVNTSQECKACSDLDYNVFSSDEILIDLDPVAAELIITQYKDDHPIKTERVEIKYCPFCGKELS